jgi:nucleotide-binding universal stress UspA family protein
MYRAILIPLDGSDFGENALPLAVSIARRFGATLQVVHVHVPEALRYDETTDRMLRERDHAYLDAVVQHLAADSRVSASSALLDTPIVEAISRHAVAAGTDLLVMSTHGRGPLARFSLGSVADALIRQVSLPVLLVPATETGPDRGKEPVIDRILIPLDGSELAEKILEPALALGDATRTQYTLLRIVKQITPASHDAVSGRVSGLRESLLKELQAMDNRQRTEAEDYLERLAARLRARSLTVQTRLVAHEQPAAAILDDAQKNAVDVIALATQGQGGMKRFFLGSVADKVVRGTVTPVLVYRPS